VTGGTGGLGRILVSTLAESGHRVVFQYLSSEGEAEKIMEETDGNTIAVRADVADPQDVHTMVGMIRERFGRLDNLINNAGVTVDGLLVQYREQDFDRVIDVNLKGTFLCSQTAGELIARSGGGHIINMSSYAGFRGKAGQVSYSASKAGIIGLGKTLAHELGPMNIRVNSVLPGYLREGMGGRVPKAMEKARNNSLLKCLSDPEEVARFLVFLCSTSNITGQVFVLDSREVI